MGMLLQGGEQGSLASILPRPLIQKRGGLQRRRAWMMCNWGRHCEHCGLSPVSMWEKGMWIQGRTETCILNTPSRVSPFHSMVLLPVVVSPPVLSCLWAVVVWHQATRVSVICFFCLPVMGALSVCGSITGGLQQSYLWNKGIWRNWNEAFPPYILFDDGAQLTALACIVLLLVQHRGFRVRLSCSRTKT